MFIFAKMVHFMKSLIIALAILLSVVVSHHARAQTFIRTGADINVDPEPVPGILLAGGATDNNDAMRWFLQQANGGDIVVIRATGSGTYNNYLYTSLGVAVNSVTTIVIPDRAAANNQEVYDAMIGAEALFIAGGNQWNYINHWKNTLVHDALNHLIHEKKITVGGTSAGLAVLGEVVFSAQNNTVWSSEALGNPYHFRVTLERDFLKIPYLENLVTDSHYNREESDGMTREGRHVAFMARMVTDWDMPARGIGVNEFTAVGVDENGLAMVFGNPAYEDYAYFIDSGGKLPEVCLEGQPLTWDHNGEALRVYTVPGNRDGSHTFDLVNWETGIGGSWSNWYVREGVLNFGQVTGTLEVSFRVLQGINEAPLEGALVSLEGHGNISTDNQGMAVFGDVEPGGLLAYQVTLAGFLGESGELSVGNESILHNIFLYPGDATTIDGPARDLPAIRIGPNPSKNRFFIENAPGTVLLQVLLLDGRGMTMPLPDFPAGGQGRKWFDVSGLMPGIYQVVVTTTENRQSFPLVIVR
jgi:cyanophycinase-like exopeptidase